MKKRFVGRGNKNRKEITCIICGKKRIVKMSIALRMKYCSIECYNIRRKLYKVYNISDKKRGILSENAKNRFKNKKLTKKHKEKISEAMTGINNPNWKHGNTPQNKHKWIISKKGKASNYKCEICKNKQAQDWSNKNHKYKKILKDWQALCRSCHEKYDKKYNKKYKYRKKA